MSLFLSVYSFAAVLLMAACAVVFLLSALLNLGVGATIAIYILFLASLVLLGTGCTKKNDYAAAFTSFSSKEIRALSYVSAGGFIIEVVSCLLQLYDYYSADTIVFGRVPLLIASAVLALLSACTMVLAGMSCGDSKYDFRRIAAVAFVPLIWSIVKAAGLLSEYANALGDASSVFKLSAVIFSMCFFYRFAFEAVSKNSASPLTVFSAGALFVSGTLFVFSRLVLTLLKQADAVSFDNLFAVTVLAVSVYALSFRRELVRDN